MSIEIKSYSGMHIYTSTTATTLQEAAEEAKVAGAEMHRADLRMLDPDFAAKQAKEAEALRQFDARTRAMGMHKKSKKYSLKADTAY